LPSGETPEPEGFSGLYPARGFTYDLEYRTTGAWSIQAPASALDIDGWLARLALGANWSMTMPSDSIGHFEHPPFADQPDGCLRDPLTSAPDQEQYRPQVYSYILRSGIPGRPRMLSSENHPPTPIAPEPPHRI